MKVILELDNAAVGALLRACELVNKGKLIESDYGAALTIRDLEKKLREMFASSIEGHKP